MPEICSLIILGVVAGFLLCIGISQYITDSGGETTEMKKSDIFYLTLGLSFGIIIGILIRCL